MRPTLLYDATIVDNDLRRGSGIYVVALNILLQLYASKKFAVFLYSSSPERGRAEAYLREKTGEQISYWPPIRLLEKKLKEKRDFWRKKRNFPCRLFFQILYGVIKRWNALSFPRWVRKEKSFDLFLSPAYAVPKEISAKKSYVFLHDTIPFLFPQYFDSGSDWIHTLAKSFSPTDRFFADSESTQKDYCRLFSVLTPENITVTPLAASENFRPVDNADLLVKAKTKYGIQGRYILSCCNLEPRKNLLRTMRTFAAFLKKHGIEDLSYVIIGSAWKNFSNDFAELLQELGPLAERIKPVGYVQSEELAPLYAGADWFVYTSQYEGFGLPPLEAMQCGCPVITSNNSSLPEVVGDAGIMIDWDSDEQHIAAYETFYFNERLRREYARKGLERAKLFSWEKTAELVIEEMLK